MQAVTAKTSIHLCRARGEWEMHNSRVRRILKGRLSVHKFNAHLLGNIMRLWFGGIAMALRDSALTRIANQIVAARVDTSLHTDELCSGAIPYIRV